MTYLDMNLINLKQPDLTWPKLTLPDLT